MRIIMQCTSDKILIKRLSNRNFIFRSPNLSRTGDKKLALEGLATSKWCILYNGLQRPQRENLEKCSKRRSGKKRHHSHKNQKNLVKWTEIFLLNLMSFTFHPPCVKNNVKSP